MLLNKQLIHYNYSSRNGARIAYIVVHHGKSRSRRRRHGPLPLFLRRQPKGKRPLFRGRQWRGANHRRCLRRLALRRRPWSPRHHQSQFHRRGNLHQSGHRPQGRLGPRPQFGERAHGLLPHSERPCGAPFRRVAKSLPP